MAKFWILCRFGVKFVLINFYRSTSVKSCQFFCHSYSIFSQLYSVITYLRLRGPLLFFGKSLIVHHSDGTSALLFGFLQFANVIFRQKIVSSSASVESFRQRWSVSLRYLILFSEWVYQYTATTSPWQRKVKENSWQKKKNSEATVTSILSRILICARPQGGLNNVGIDKIGKLLDRKVGNEGRYVVRSATVTVDQIDGIIEIYEGIMRR